VLGAVVLGAGACGGAAEPSPPGGGSLEQARWHLAGTVAEGGRAVPLVYTTDECVRTPGEDTGAQAAARFERADVDLGDGAVTVTVLLGPSEDAGQGSVACGKAPIAVERTVMLPEPLGDRELRDGSTSPTTVVRPPR
jgi:hypothetical protein